MVTGTGGERGLLVDLFRAGLRAVEGGRATARSLREKPPAACRWFIAGAGKAACAMAEGAIDVLGDAVVGGVVTTRDDCAFPVARVDTRVADHPIPDARSEAAARETLERVASLPPDCGVLALISGGASALWAAPSAGVTLADMRRLTALLLERGADIESLNRVRRQLSDIKGGGLARAAGVRPQLALCLSDVPGDRPETIGSGPLAPDPFDVSDGSEALRTLEVFLGPDEIPRAVRERLARIQPSRVARPEHRIVASLSDLLRAVAASADAAGLVWRIELRGLDGEARALPPELLDRARRAAREGVDLLVLGGEPTVQVRGEGSGGREQELALAFALAIDGAPDCTALFAGTDGSDGPTDAAGAIVDGGTAARARSAGLDPEDALARNDSHPLLRATGDLLVTGATRTNVADVGLIRLGGMR